MTSPTARTLEWSKKRGWLVATLERWNAWAKIRQDVFGLDLLALDGKHAYGIQVTSTANIAARRNKLDAMPSTAKLLAAGVRVLVIGWSRRGPRSKRKLWAPVVYEADGWGWSEWPKESLLVEFGSVPVAQGIPVVEVKAVRQGEKATRAIDGGRDSCGTHAE